MRCRRMTRWKCCRWKQNADGWINGWCAGSAICAKPRDISSPKSDPCWPLTTPARIVDTGRQSTGRLSAHHAARCERLKFRPLAARQPRHYPLAAFDIHLAGGTPIALPMHYIGGKCIGADNRDCPKPREPKTQRTRHVTSAGCSARNHTGRENYGRRDAHRSRECARRADEIDDGSACGAADFAGQCEDQSGAELPGGSCPAWGGDDFGGGLLGR